MKRIVAKFVYSPDDAVTAYRMQHSQTSETWKLCALMAGLHVIVFTSFAIALDFWIYSLLGGGLAAGSFLSLIPETRLRRSVEKLPRQEQEIGISERGIEINDNYAQFLQPWSEIKKAHIDERGLLLFFVSEICLFIPARAFIKGYFPRNELKPLITSQIKSPNIR